MHLEVGEKRWQYTARIADEIAIKKINLETSKPQNLHFRVHKIHRNWGFHVRFFFKTSKVSEPDVNVSNFVVREQNICTVRTLEHCPKVRTVRFKKKSLLVVSNLHFWWFVPLVLSVPHRLAALKQWEKKFFDIQIMCQSWKSVRTLGHYDMWCPKLGKVTQSSDREVFKEKIVIEI